MDKNRNNSLKMLFYLSGIIVLILSVVAVTNISVDPMCYYHCDELDIKRSTQNLYYQSAQLVAGNPGAKILILGSSRGQTLSPLWVEKMTGMKTVNLSQGGASLYLKMALLRIASDYKLPLKKVIWIADYFEIAGDVTDVKVRQTDVLRKQLGQELENSGKLKEFLESIQRLFDHSSFEASLKQLSSKNKNKSLDLSGSGSDIDFEKCQHRDFQGLTPKNMIQKEVQISYSAFGPMLRAKINQKFLSLMKSEIQKIASAGIEVEILIPPFHPELMDKLLREHPEVRADHIEWLGALESLKSEKIHILNYWNGTPSDNLGPTYWNDGAHPTCKSMMLMLGPILKGIE
jgi:hypothetical protein